MYWDEFLQFSKYNEAGRSEIILGAFLVTFNKNDKAILMMRGYLNNLSDLFSLIA